MKKFIAELVKVTFGVLILGRSYVEEIGLEQQIVSLR